jgi:Bacterial RNA polymerase, alpha chain C terminal domain
MKQVGARHDIIREWRSLPKEQRQTDEQAEAFAMQIKDKYKFSSDSADRYQTVRGWLLSYLSLTRGLGVNAKDKGEMSGNEKSADPDLSAAERKALRVRDAQEAVADHEKAQTAFQENRERLRKERLLREATEGPMVAPTPELPDDTPIDRLLFSSRIQNALQATDLKTVGEIREASDPTLLSLQNLGSGSIAHLRSTLGLPSTDGVRPKSKKPRSN